jgi:tungstate transport system ATP-binding protein
MSESGGEPLVELRDITVEPGRRSVLQLERLAVVAGEVLAVIGPNGAGKSTLLLTLAGLIRPTAGELLYRGQAIRPREALAYRRRLALVLQEPLLLDASVLDNVTTGLRFRRQPRSQVLAQAQRWLERFAIGHLARRPAGQISGGEQQRVSLARAFALEPELLLLDEPFSSLDPPTRSRLLDELHGLLAETRMTAVFVTHDMNEAARLADRVAVLLGGRLRQSGRPEQVLTDPEVAAFIGLAPPLAWPVDRGG